MEAARQQKWPDMRFCLASVYAVGKMDQCPQYEAFMDKNEDYVLLVHPKESTTYCKREDARLYTNRTMALLGEPTAEWKAKQKAWQDLDERSRQQESVNESGMVVTQAAQEAVNTGTYIEQAGEKS